MGQAGNRKRITYSSTGPALDAVGGGAACTVLANGAVQQSKRKEPDSGPRASEKKAARLLANGAGAVAAVAVAVAVAVAAPPAKGAAQPPKQQQQQQGQATGAAAVDSKGEKKRKRKLVKQPQQPSAAAEGTANGMEAAGSKGMKQQKRYPAKQPQLPSAAAEGTADGTEAAGSLGKGNSGGSNSVKKKGWKKKMRVMKGSGAAVAAAGARVIVPVTAVPGKGTAAGGNWQQLQQKLGVGRGNGAAAAAANKQRRGASSGVDSGAKGAGEFKQSRGATPSNLREEKSVTQVLAIDCEMVGVGPDGVRSALARVCVVNNYGAVLLDVHVDPGEKVTDYRTRVSGIRPSDLKGALAMAVVQRQVAELTAGRILVGHALKNDLQALMLSHPAKDLRDTARYPPLMRRATLAGGKLRSQQLRMLAQQELGLAIQEGEHSPVDDARAALYLYHRHRKDWERAIKQGGVQALRHPQADGGASATGSKWRRQQVSLEELAANDQMVDL